MTQPRRFAPAPALAILLGLGGWACSEEVTNVGNPPAAPANLSYRLEPSTDPDLPAGIVLTWDEVLDTDLDSYYLYSRGSTTAAFGLRGITSSNTFHDNGVPHLQYAVIAVDQAGNLSNFSNIVTINESLRLDAPSILASVSLNQAIHLSWSDNAFLSDPDAFDSYRIYSTAYDLDTGLCGSTWALEGTTVAPAFLVGALANGVPHCYGVSALSIEGYQSLWSPVRQDTPRPDARNVLVYALEENAAAAGFRFWDDVNADGQGQPSELGIVKSGNATDVDFRIYRDAFDTLWIEPVFSGTRMQVYDQVSDLTDIDFAPATGYARTALQAIPTYGYVFEIVEGSTVRYGALRVTHMGRGDYVIFDWSFQTDFGNPELVVRGGLPVVSGTGSTVSGNK